MDIFLKVLEKSWFLISTPFIQLGGNNLSILSLLTGVMIFLLSIYLSNIAEKFVNKYLQTKDFDQGIKGSIERFTKYAIMIIGALIALDTLGVSLQSLAAIGAVLMVGIGFGLQNITSNFISGLIILLERPIKRGDIVNVGGSRGKVMDIGARSTIIHTPDDISVIVPNSKFISEKVINESFSGDYIRFTINIGVAYGSDVQKVKEVLLSLANNHKDILKTPVPYVHFTDFGDSSLAFELKAWARTLMLKKQIASDLRFQIDESFKVEGISIPFPQREVRILKD